MEEELNNNVENMKELEEELKDFYIKNEQDILSYFKEVEQIEDQWKKYFKDNLAKIEKDVIHDVNIKEEDMEEECLRRAEELREKTVSFIKRDIDISLEEVKNKQK